MENGTMGRVVVTARIENLSDLHLCERGMFPSNQVRFVEVTDALVDTGASMLSLPRQLIDQLGLTSSGTRPVRTANGTRNSSVYGAVRLHVQGRNCIIDVIEVPADCPVLIGQIPLELMDFVVDPNGQRLIGNPAHGGEQMVELYSFLPP